jgi:multidrug resistance efflux pump
MDDWRPTRTRAGLLRRWRTRARTAIPALVWLLAAVAVTVLGASVPRTGEFPAFADTAHGFVQAPSDGRIRTVSVSLHDEVDAGQVLAHLDDTELRLQLATATARLEELRADMVLTGAGIDHAARLAANDHALQLAFERRRLHAEAESNHLAALTAHAELAETRIRAQGVEIAAERLDTLAARGLVNELELVQTRTERDAMRTRVTELTLLYTETRARHTAAAERARTFAPTAPDSLAADTTLAPHRWRLRAQEAELERIAATVERLAITAPIAGRVAALHTRPGEWAAAGTTLVTIVDPTPRRILAYLPDTGAQRLAAAQAVRVHRLDHTLLGTSRVQSVSPTVVELPERMRRDPRVPEWGYEFVLAATGHELPGERVRLVPLR